MTESVRRTAGIEPFAERGEESLAIGVTRFVVLYIAAYVYTNTFAQSSAAPFWPPGAVLLATLLLSPPRRWWIFLVLPLPIRLLDPASTNASAWLIVGLCVNGALEALLAASILRRRYVGTFRLDSLRKLVWFTAAAVVLMPMLSAFIGAFQLLAIDLPFWISWKRWFLGDALANLLLAPTILYWTVDPRPALFTASGRRRAEILLVSTALLGVSFVTLSNDLFGLSKSAVGAFLPFPLLLYTAVRFGPRGTATSLALVTAVAIWGAEHGRGPFVGHAPDEDLLAFQLFFVVLTLPLLAVATLLQEVRRANVSLRNASDQLRRLSGRLMHIQEEERRRIAYELHDNLGQNLAIIANWAALGRRAMHSEDPPAQHLEEILSTAAATMSSVHEIVHQLRPVELDRLGLVKALDLMLDKLALSSSLRLTRELDPIDGLLTPDAEASVYRIVQEGTSNVVKHAEATEAHVSVKRVGDRLVVSVQDDGTGFDARDLGDARPGFGLAGIAERVHAIGGSCTVTCPPEGGTLLLVTLDRLPKIGLEA